MCAPNSHLIQKFREHTHAYSSCLIEQEAQGIFGHPTKARGLRTFYSIQKHTPKPAAPCWITNTHLRRKHESEALGPSDFPQTSKKVNKAAKTRMICDSEIKINSKRYSWSFGKILWKYMKSQAFPIIGTIITERSSAALVRSIFCLSCRVRFFQFIQSNCDVAL